MDAPERVDAELLPNPAVVSEEQPVPNHGLSSAPAIHLLAENAIARPSQDGPEASVSAQEYYTSAQWTPDGTSLLVSSSLNKISTFVLPDDLLDPSTSRPRHLAPQSSISLPEPTQTIAAAPYFSLAEPSSQTVLVGCRDHPLHLYHLFPQDGAPNVPLATYKLIRRETEEYITPSSLLWEHTGTHFLCGSTNRIDYFDMTRHGSDGPLLTIPTIPSKRHIAKGNGVGMKGNVSTLAASPMDANGGSIVAAGTWTRWVGLYDIHRTDKTVANFTIANTEGIDGAADVAGQGIVQVCWSPCGRYLVVNERQSKSLLVYDIRGSGRLLSVLGSRNATTQQKLTLDVFPGASSSDTSFFEVWAGSRDGSVDVWEGVGSQFGVVEPSWDWKAHNSPVGSTIVHSSGSVAATCSGGWGAATVRDIDEGFGVAGSHPRTQNVFDESGLRVWTIGG
ncbi:WD40-repeat-containing domain protein [Thelonectria olida]|uniref:WD40-repeat-containing domain protein n=1 Tax=Thelonectria olida TaxID=1576542 RepID=A0A9P8WBV3_9HYPO|nr:WD40-repeat-containing domain protein [Thelonectria olida]